MLQQQIIASQGKDSLLATAVGNDLKGKASLGFYLLAFVLAFVLPVLADALYVLVALLWLFPDRRIEIALCKKRKRPLPTLQL